MSDTVISVENLSKSYLVGHQGPQERYHSLRDTIVRHGKNYVRKAVDMARGRQIIQGDSVEEFWALKDVSFEVKRGEVLGIIGRNGAGKSTLLKILSRITEPTSGRVVLDGRVASLLEVGTGFHPELTGRENIFLNGAILGMSKVEIRKKFDEIVDFAGVEKFLDTPVKRYSSGMYVRLAFSVAAHLEPEILVVDEVLAVGDTEFQTKCLGKMESVAANGGRTVLFVSHNLSAISRLCQRAILLNRGQVDTSGVSMEVIDRYLNSATIHSPIFRPPVSENSKSAASLDFATFNTTRGASSVCPGDSITIELSYRLNRDVQHSRVGFRLHAGDGTVVFTSTNADTLEGPTSTLPVTKGSYHARCVIPENILNQGNYYLTIASDIPNQEVSFFYENALCIHVDRSVDISPSLADGRLGVIAPLLKWQTTTLKD